VAAGGTDAPRRIDALIQVGLRLARSASSRRLLLARVAVAGGDVVVLRSDDAECVTPLVPAIPTSINS